MMGRLQFAVGLAVCAASLAGCAHETAADRAPRSSPVARLAPVGDPPWRETFGAPALAELLNRADAGAFDIKLALARLDRAQADIDIARAATRPQVSVGLAGASGGRQLDSHRERAAPTLEVAYDFDLGGRISRLRAAAAAEHDASADDVTSARLLVAAATSRLYVTYCVAQDAIAAAARRNDEASRMMSLVRARRAEGVATQVEEHLGQAALDAASERDRAAHLEATSALNGLASLIGADHVAVECPGGIPVPSAAPTSLNADLVDQRPETRAAFARVKAADFRRAAAVAAERPRFEISAVIGAPDAAIVTLLGTRALAWALAAGVDPAAYIRKYKGRCPVVHAKDIVLAKNGRKQQLKPLGQGDQNWPEIFAAGDEAGIEWYVYEQDNGVGSPFDFAHASYEFLSKQMK